MVVKHVALTCLYHMYVCVYIYIYIYIYTIFTGPDPPWIEICTRDQNIYCHKPEVSTTSCNNNFNLYESYLLCKKHFNHKILKTVQVVPFIHK
jgi:hypothetical protein